MYYAILKSGVIVAKKKSELQSNTKIRGLLDHDEFISVGPDYVINLTDSDIDFIQDKRKLSQIMFSGFFRKDNSVKVLVIVNIILTALIFFQQPGQNDILNQLLERVSQIPLG